MAKSLKLSEEQQKWFDNHTEINFSEFVRLAIDEKIEDYKSG